MAMAILIILTLISASSCAKLLLKIPSNLGNETTATVASTLCDGRMEECLTGEDNVESPFQSLLNIYKSATGNTPNPNKPACERPDSRYDCLGKKGKINHPQPCSTYGRTCPSNQQQNDKCLHDNLQLLHHLRLPNMFLVLLNLPNNCTCVCLSKVFLHFTWRWSFSSILPYYICTIIGLLLFNIWILWFQRDVDVVIYGHLPLIILIFGMVITLLLYI